jgi:hypothetical protein
MAVFLQSEEVMCASDVELCVGLLFTLGTRKESLEELAQLSPKALTGLAQLVKQSTSATSRRFGAKTLYLLSLSSKLSWSKQSALVNVAEAMAYRDMAFNGFPLKDTSSAAIRWQGERHLPNDPHLLGQGNTIHDDNSEDKPLASLVEEVGRAVEAMCTPILALPLFQTVSTPE